MNNLESVCQDLGLELDGRDGHVTKPLTLSCKLFEDSVYVNTDALMEEDLKNASESY